MAIYAYGRVQFADGCKDHDEALRPAMIELQTFLTYEKQLRNLQLQESRLSRRREKELAEFRNLQKERSRRDADDLDMASKLYLAALNDKIRFDAAEHGFEFSTADIEDYLRGVRAAQIARTALNSEKSKQQAA